MKTNLWVFFAIIAGFMGFLLGYSTPPMMEVGLGDGSHGESVSTEEQESSSEQDMADYYKQLQELQ